MPLTSAAPSQPRAVGIGNSSNQEPSCAKALVGHATNSAANNRTDRSPRAATADGHFAFRMIPSAITYRDYVGLSLRASYSMADMHAGRHGPGEGVDPLANLPRLISLRSLRFTGFGSGHSMRGL